MADIGWITGHSYVVYGPLCNGATTVLFESTPLYPDPGCSIPEEHLPVPPQVFNRTTLSLSHFRFLNPSAFCNRYQRVEQLYPLLPQQCGFPLSCSWRRCGPEGGRCCSKISAVFFCFNAASQRR
ncbi:hypothetical protein AMECASPLE_039446 [Ameca splendens]|uniref:Uncharacterized protein n=1 Tax=Ameca splendens TaxID=208324 RepID=A0ABV0YJL0_9TELE